MFHSLDICEQIGDRLNKIDLSSMQYQEGVSLSLAHGWPAMAIFYSTLHNFFPNKKYDERAHSFLEATVKQINSVEHLSLSLLQGITGICISAQICSKEGRRYAKLITKLDELFIEKLDVHLNSMGENAASPTYYMAYGISGALTYLLCKQNNPLFVRYTQTTLTKLIELMNKDYSILGHSVPGWYESQESLWHPVEKEHFPNGKFTIGLLSGVAGVLASLSSAVLNGVRVDKINETILKLALWLKGKAKETREFKWPKMISFENEIGEQTENQELDLGRSWEEETPFVLRSLYLAAKAIKDKSLQDFAEKGFLKTISNSSKLNNCTLILGKAGLLATAYRMGQDTHNPNIFKQVSELEWQLKNAFNSAFPYGYQTIEGSKELGLLEGVSGIALTLLLVQGREDNHWDRIFFWR
jgi:lantibiotic modifying enzyme